MANFGGDDPPDVKIITRHKWHFELYLNECDCYRFVFFFKAHDTFPKLWRASLNLV